MSGDVGPAASRELAGARRVIDTSVAHSARVHDYWLGGKDNFAADRAAADAVMAVYPGIVMSVRANRAFLARAVRFLAAEAGIRQFLASLNATVAAVHAANVMTVRNHADTRMAESVPGPAPSADPGTPPAQTVLNR